MFRLFAVEPLQQFLQQKGCCRGLYSRHALSHSPISSTALYSDSTALYSLYSLYSSTAVLQYTPSTTPLCKLADQIATTCTRWSFVDFMAQRLAHDINSAHNAAVELEAALEADIV